MDNNTRPAESTPGGSNRRAIVGLTAAIAVALAGWLLIRELQAQARLEDCLSSGRRDCTPIVRSN
ncbi:MAG: hypothetical protein WCC64_13050 [Aliidongia sp.]